MSWHSWGFRLCGMVELPTVPAGVGSATSPYSVFMSVKISRPILPPVPPSRARTQTYSANWSAELRAGTGIDR